MIICQWNCVWVPCFVTGSVSGRFWRRVSSAGKPTGSLRLEFGNILLYIFASLNLNRDCIRDCALIKLCILCTTRTVCRCPLRYFVIFNVRVLCGWPCPWSLTYEELCGCVHVCDLCAYNVSRFWLQRFSCCHIPKGNYAFGIPILLAINFAKWK